VTRLASLSRASGRALGRSEAVVECGVRLEVGGSGAVWELRALLRIEACVCGRSVAARQGRGRGGAEETLLLLQSYVAMVELWYGVARRCCHSIGRWWCK
jgi:hypothetical protein